MLAAIMKRIFPLPFISTARSTAIWIVRNGIMKIGIIVIGPRLVIAQI